ncbi:MAG: hypothetical protein J6B04_04340 [Clostridia bacterium]|nr:hypothetical protein [Clostridia bacterium]
MTKILSFLERVYSLLAALSFNSLAAITFCSYLAIYLTVLILSLTVKALSSANKKPFFYLTNAYSAVTLALFLTEYNLSFSLFVAIIFWVVGYILYGTLKLGEKEKVLPKQNQNSVVITSTKTSSPPFNNLQPDIPAAKSNVRLEHALSITEKLLLKSLGRGDRQELEKMRYTLNMLQAKGNLTPQEGEILNENFNALLKLMARYNV